MQRTVPALVALVSTICLVPRAAQANAILNAGFEQSGFASWTVSTPSSGSFLYEGGHGHSSRSAAWFGSIGSVDDTISQALATDPGESYTVTFWLAHDVTDHSNDFRVWWNGTLLDQLINAGSFGYTAFSFVTTAAGSSSTLTFGGRDLMGYYRLDDVTVQPMSSTPEPATLVLLGSAVIASQMTKLRRRRRKRMQ